MGGKRTSDLIPLCHPLAADRPRRPDHARPRRQRAAHPGRGRDGGPDRGRDGGPHRRLGRRAHRVRHGQGRGTGRRDPVHRPRLARPAARAAIGIASTAGRGRRRRRPAAPPARRAVGRPDRAAGRVRAEPAERRVSERPAIRRTAFVLTTSDRCAAGDARGRVRAARRRRASRRSGSRSIGRVVADERPEIEAALVGGAPATRSS